MEVVTVGETMAMLVPESGRTLADSPVLAIHAGGAESNVATYLARMGVPVRWASVMSDDPLAHRILAEVGAAGVDVSAVDWGEGQTGIYLKNPGTESTTVFYYRNHSASRRLDPTIWNDQRLRDSRVLHLTGITPALSDTARAAVEAAMLERCTGAATVSFDVNFRPGLWAAQEASALLQKLANAADIVFVGLDEARVLWGCETSESVHEMLPGSRVVVVKDGAVGAHAFVDEEHIFVPSRRVDVVEPVGAGDAFAAGYLKGMLDGLEIANSLRLGHLLAATAMAIHGDAAEPPSAAWLASQLKLSEDDWASELVMGNSLEEDR